MSLKQQNWIATVILLISVVSDQITKIWAQNNLLNKGPVHILGDFFIFQYAENSGAFLSLGSTLSDSARFWIFTCFVFIFLMYLAFHLFFRLHNAINAIAITFVLSGGIGNLIDRAFRGKVIDFMNLGIGDLRTGIFNIADMAIVAGVLLLLIFPQPKSKIEHRPQTN